MTKWLEVGDWLAHAEVKGTKGGYNMVLVIPFMSRECAGHALEELGKGEKIVERKVEEPK